VVFTASGTEAHDGQGLSPLCVFGLGLAIAVIMDATLVRATLVPAFMKLAGEANWWAPRPLRRLYERFGFSEAEPPAAADPEPAPLPTSV